MSENRRKPHKRSSVPLVTFLLVVLAGILYMGWNYLSGNLPWQQSQEGEAPSIAWLEKEAGEVETLQPKEQAETTLHLAPGETQPSPAPQNECLQTADKILLFFEHLDRQYYIREYALKGSTLDHFKGIISKLMANPPVVARETDDLFAILNNMAHFFRILGLKDTLMVKDILMHEQELIEPSMALFYKWSEIAPECAADVGLNIELPLTRLYEYAGYFINTLGGQSYLFRRELYLRALTRYYSILVIDRANSVDANLYGIDIRYTLDALIEEIQGNSALVNRQEYLENLMRLQEKYQARYSSN
jgi:hypothetical protein